MSIQFERYSIHFCILLFSTGIAGFAETHDASESSRHLSPNTFQDPSNWEQAGLMISKDFPGTDSQWLSTYDHWSIPGLDSKDRNKIEYKGIQRTNHMQYSVKTKGIYNKFHMHLSFRFDEEAPIKSLQEPGNSGIYIFGLYEIQLLNTSRFLKEGKIPKENVQDGKIQVDVDGKLLKENANKCLCGAVYGGGTETDDPLIGSPTDKKGNLVNLCHGKGKWNNMDIFFVPPRFNEKGEKTHHATVSVFINSQRVYFNGKDRFAIQNPTGSQQKRFKKLKDSERKALGLNEIQGPIVIQDHGQRVSFNNLKINPDWDPGKDWAIAVR